MSKRWQVIIAAALIAALIAILAIAVPRTTLATSVVDLLPGDSPEIRILQELAEKDQGRLLTVRLDSGDDGTVSKEALTVFITHLKTSASIEDAWIADNRAFEEVGKLLFQNRYLWLLPRWLDQNVPNWHLGNAVVETDLAETVVRQMEAYLQAPEGFALSETIPQDPFLLLRQLEDTTGLLPEDTDRRFAKIWVKASQSPFTEAGQGPVFAALDDAVSVASEKQPALTMEYSGLSVFAHASKAHIKNEIQRLNLLGLFLVLLITLFAVPDRGAVFRICIVLVTTLLAATTVVFTLFSSVHIIALVIGSILAGIAVDYAFHLILRESHGLPESRVTKAVLTGSLSSALGFAILLWAPLVFLQQVGAFVGSGLLTALLVSLLLRPGASGQTTTRAYWIKPFSLFKWLGPVVLLMAIPGLLHLDWRDSISDLQYPLPELEKIDEAINAESAARSDRIPYLVHGENILEARDQLEQMLQSSPTNAEWIHGGKWIPPFEKARLAQACFMGLDGFEDNLYRALENSGFVSDAFEEFSRAWKAYLANPVTPRLYEDRLNQLAARLPGPLGNFIHTGGGQSWFMLIAPKGTVLPAQTGLIELDQSSLLTNAFSSYRKTIVTFAGICFLIVSLGVILVYGLPTGLFILAIPTIALVSAYGLSGYLHSGLGLFHVIGGILSFCIGLDYALFAVESYRQGRRMPASVTISILTTMGVFGLLSTSRIPGVHQLAFTVLAVIGFSLILILAGWPFLRRPTIPGRRALACLPHGPEAIMIRKTLQLKENHIEVECFPNEHQPAPVECLVEGMAQAAALWLAATSKNSRRQRKGMLVIVQNCETCVPLLPVGRICLARIACPEGPKEGLLVFTGDCLNPEGEVLIKATFSILIPPIDRPS